MFRVQVLEVMVECPEHECFGLRTWPAVLDVRLRFRVPISKLSRDRD